MKPPPPAHTLREASLVPQDQSLQSALRRLALDAQWLQIPSGEVAEILRTEMGRRAPNATKEIQP